MAMGFLSCSNDLKTVCLQGCGGPYMAADVDTNGCEFVGTIRHQLSHRELVVSVWKSDGASGTNPQEVALSTLDRRLLELAGIVTNVP